MLDPFLGIGNSAIAAQRCGVKKFVGFEIDEDYLAEAEAPNRGAKFVRLIGSERNSPSIAKRDRNSIPSGNIVEPAVWRQVNSPAVPPSNPDWFTVGDVDQLDFSKCKSRTKHCAHVSVIDR